MNTIQKYKNISIRKETYEKLVTKGNLEDSFDSVINKLLQSQNQKQDLEVSK